MKIAYYTSTSKRIKEVKQIKTDGINIYDIGIYFLLTFFFTVALVFKYTN